MERSTKLYLMFIVMFVLVLGFAVSYAYFSSLINNDASSLTIGSGKLEVEYADQTGGNIIISNVYPRESEWITKKFKLLGSNTTNLNAYYKIKIIIDNNTFDDLALSYSLVSENTNSNGSVISSVSNVGISSADVLLGQGYFSYTGSSSKEHNYTLKIYFKDNGEDQNSMQEAKFAAHIEISEGAHST